MTTCFCKHDAARVKQGDKGYYWFVRGKSWLRLCQHCGAWCDVHTGIVRAPTDSQWLGDCLPWSDRAHLRQFIMSLLSMETLQKMATGGLAMPRTSNGDCDHAQSKVPPDD